MEAATYSNTTEKTWVSVDSSNVARLLTDITELRMLEPFFSPCTVKAAAEQLKVTLDDLYYRVRRAEKVGLLRVVNTQPRAGRAIKHYALCADGFFVPNQIVPDMDFRSLLKGFQLPLEHVLNHNLMVADRHANRANTLGLRFYRNEHGQLVIDIASGPHEPYDFLAPNNPATFTGWHHLNLDFEDAKALQQDLQDVWLKYARKRGGQQYLLRLALAPLLEESSG